MTLLEQKNDETLVVQEKAFYNHLANLTDLLYGFQPQLDSGMGDFVDKEKITEYHNLYKNVLQNSPFKNICSHNSRKKEFVITNTDKSREIFLKNIPQGLKDHFWQMGKSISINN